MTVRPRIGPSLRARHRWARGQPQKPLRRAPGKPEGGQQDQHAAQDVDPVQPVRPSELQKQHEARRRCGKADAERRKPGQTDRRVALRRLHSPGHHQLPLWRAEPTATSPRPINAPDQGRRSCPAFKPLLRHHKRGLGKPRPAVPRGRRSHPQDRGLPVPSRHHPLIQPELSQFPSIARDMGRQSQPSRPARLTRPTRAARHRFPRSATGSASRSRRWRSP